MIPHNVPITARFFSPRASTGDRPPNLVSNGSFETLGAGGFDVFEDWGEVWYGKEAPEPDPEPIVPPNQVTDTIAGYILGIDTDSGELVDISFSAYASGTHANSVTITADVSDPYVGTYACKMYSDLGGNVWGGVYIDVTVDSQSGYHLTFQTKTSGGYSSEQARYGVMNMNTGEWIVNPVGTYAFADSWSAISAYFRTPVQCSLVRLYLFQNVSSGSSVYIDAVSLMKRVDISTRIVGEIEGVIQYTHTINASGGFDTAAITTTMTLPEVADWIENGLMRGVEMHDHLGSFWEGFVNQISFIVAGVSLNAGPIITLVNRARIAYQEVNYNVNPPVGGANVATQWLNQTESQKAYGIMEGVITGGSGSATEMLALLGTILETSSKAESSESVATGGADAVSVTINMMGYSRLLEKYFYYQLYESGETSVYEKLAAILDSDPNGYVSSRNSYIFANPLQVRRWEGEDRTALTTIQEIVAMGDSEYNRYHWGVYENNRFVYDKASVINIEYDQDIGSGIITDASGAEMIPWRIRPGKWLRVSSFLPGRAIDPASYRTDPRIIFIESVSFTTPTNVAIQGGKASSFRQRLERLGLGGI